MWIVLHSLFLYWAIQFPFNYRQLKNSGRLRYAHMASLLLGLVIPLPAGLVPLRYGYVANVAPIAMVCLGSNKAVSYYTFILPVSIFLAVTVCLLVLMFWAIFKVSMDIEAITRRL